MNLKITYQGSSPQFLRRMAAFADTVPDLVRRVDSLDLQASYTGLKAVRFVETPISGDKFIYDKSKDEILVFPSSFQAGDRIDSVLYQAFGRRHWTLNVANDNRIKWVRMYAFPSKSLIDRIIGLLNGEHTFKDVLSQFKTANDKLVTMHILNAFTRSSITPSSLPAINVRQHACVRDFIDGRRAYSLIPLMSVYGGSLKRIGQYEEAFSEYCVNNGGFRISETSTNTAFVELFKSVSGV